MFGETWEIRGTSRIAPDEGRRKEKLLLRKGKKDLTQEKGKKKLSG